MASDPARPMPKAVRSSVQASVRRWKQLTPSPTKHVGRCKHTAVYYKKQMIVFGGHDPWKDCFLNDLLVYDSATARWRDVEKEPEFQKTRDTHREAPSQRRAHSAGVLGAWMVVFGGFSGKDCFSDVRALNVETWEWVHLTPVSPPGGAPVRPCARGGHSCTPDPENGCLYITGGWDTALRYHNDVWSMKPDFEAKTVTWASLTPKSAPEHTPLGRVGHSCCLLRGKLVLFGGYGGDTYHNDVRVFDIAALAWSVVTTDPAFKKPRPRNYHCSALSPSGKLLLLGGAYVEGLMDDVWQLDLSGVFDDTAANTSESAPSLPKWGEVSCPGANRFAHTCVADPDTGVLYVYGVSASDESDLLELVIEDWYCDQSLAHHMTRYLSKHYALFRSALPQLASTVTARISAYHAELALPFSPAAPPFSQPSTPLQPRNPAASQQQLDTSPLVL
ncbi:RING finger protein B [Diplonema papillatum]|nr:RING finger protein B [Diplonema papillatum]